MTNTKPGIPGMTALTALTNRRWLAAIGGVVSVLLFARKCGRDDAPVTAALAAHDVVDRTLEQKIKEQKQIAENGRKAESAAVAEKQRFVTTRAFLAAERAARVSSTERARRTAVLTEEARMTAADTVVDHILAEGDSALSAAHVQIGALATALDLSEARATASDSVLHLVAKDSAERCRILDILPCPSRLVTVALTAAAIAVLILR